MRADCAGLALLVAVACGDKGDDTAGGAEGHPTLQIDAPVDGAWFDQGDEIEFSASGRSADGADADVVDAVWTTEGWTQSGASFTATDLPPGVLDIALDATVDGEALTATVSISVYANRGI